MISIINYGLGNVLAFQNIFKKLNIESKVVSNASELAQVSKIILPGVGSFDWAMDKLNNSGMRDQLDYLVLEKKVPVMGICVGMQMMANSSEEGDRDGLGWFNAHVKKISSEKDIDLPHMGWNNIIIKNSSSLFEGLKNDARFYFLHSYYFETKEDNSILTETDYGGLFTSAAQKNNIFAIQFHPEKSHHWGERLLMNFSKIKNA